MAKITLTFDNGPDPAATPGVLDTLAERDLKAIFFVVGNCAARHPDLVERAASEGHWIGNHTFHHDVPFGELARAEQAVAEIAETQALIATVAHPDKLFRPFGGGGHLDRRLLNRVAVDYLVAEGFSCVLWNSVPRDWERPDDWVEVALADCDRHDWTVVVLHDFEARAMRHLPAFLDGVEKAGHEIVQEIPESCLAIHRGNIRMKLDDWMPL